ncbi:CBO0543 family protein (plasmid) [Niallia taxi]|uniref:CBO0543 family protein n=1 Tax=Niallia taxi TaxID=2499688 RepID=UPI003F5EE0FA
MKDKTILNIITIIGLSGWSIFCRKGPIKDWLLVYLFKAVITALIDVPIARKKIVQYPTRYFPKLYETNIIFDYVIFPLVCVIYSQFTNRMNGIKVILFVFILSIPMTLIEGLLERKTMLIHYSDKWNWLHTFTYLTVTFWLSRLFVACTRLLKQVRHTDKAFFYTNNTENT